MGRCTIFRSMLVALVGSTQRTDVVNEAVAKRGDTFVHAFDARGALAALGDRSPDVVILGLAEADVAATLRSDARCTKSIFIVLLDSAPTGSNDPAHVTGDDYFVTTFGGAALRKRLDLYDRGAGQERERFFAVSFDLLCVAHTNGYFEHVNEAWTRTLGWTSAELCASPWLEFVHPRDLHPTIKAEEAFTRGASVTDFSNRFRCRDNSYRWLEWQATAAEGGRIYAAARDVSAVRAAREAELRIANQLIVAHRLACLGALAGGIAHEISNRLSYVTEHLDLMREKLEPVAELLPLSWITEMTSSLQDASLGAARLRDVVRGLRSFSADGADDRRVVLDLRQIVESSIHMAFNEIRHRACLVKDYGPVPHVMGSEARLGQVFISLLLIAARAIHDGKTPENEIRIVTATAPSGGAIVEIRYTGQEISSKLPGQIFDPFTSRPVGEGADLGSGLAICHNIVDSMRGSIAIESTATTGTTFRVVLPPAGS